MKWETLSRINGLFVGLLDEDELEIFNKACKSSEATRSYEGAGGLLGLAKVRVHKFGPIPYRPSSE